MKRSLTFVLFLSLLFSSCTPATQPPQPTITLTIAPTQTPNPTATATITITPALTPPVVNVPENIIGVLPEQIKITSLETARMVDARGLGKGIEIARDDKGRVMLVKPEGSEKWLVAPLGRALVNGEWKVYEQNDNGVFVQLKPGESFKRMQREEELEPIVEIVENELRQDAGLGKLQAYSEVTSSGMEILPGKDTDTYDYILGAIAGSRFKGSRDYFQAFGVKGTSSSDLLARLQTSFGPNGEAYWLPAEVGGHQFKFLQSDIVTTSYAMRQSPLISEGGGIQLDKFYFMLYTEVEYENNPFARASADKVLKQNDASPDSLLYWGGGGKLLSYGLQVTSDNRFAFVVINTFRSWDPDFNRIYVFGDEDGNHVELDSKRYTTYLQNYVELTRKVSSESNVSDDKMCFSAETQWCTTTPESKLPVIIYNVEPWFEFNAN